MSVQFWAIVIIMSFVAIAFVAGTSSKTEWRTKKLLLAAMAAIPVFAIVFYLDVGSPDAIDINGLHQGDRVSTMPTQVNTQRKPIGSVSSMLDGLKRRLDENPEDAGSWLLLAKSYDHLNRREEAIAAYRQAESLGKTDLSLAQALGDSVSLRDETQTSPVPSLRGTVELSAAARDLVRPGDTVFIFAKESVNQRMPLVAKRKSVQDLPIQFNLTDADAMIAGTHLADYEELVVTAKISRSGMATDVLEGLEVFSQGVSPLSDQVISLTIASNQNSSSEVGTAND